MSTYILYESLRLLSADVDYRIPDRILDGYGMNITMVEEAEKSRIDLLLTCDNGISAAGPIAAAKEKGMEVIVTDHHELPNHRENGETIFDLPPADCVVDPKQPGETYPEKAVCGAVVAYKVISLVLLQLGEEPDFAFFGGKEGYLRELLVMAAFATVCDVMELRGENRKIVKRGLSLIPECKNIGIKALVKACGMDEMTISAYHAGFVIGPCFNATGRLQSALLGLELLLCSDWNLALEKAEQFKELNEKRKLLTVQATKEAAEQAEKKLAEGKNVLVIFLPDCHESIAGIVAGRIREKFFRPTIILTRGENNIKGSGRSIEGYSMFEKLTEQKESLIAFGGHPMAAGLSLKEENIPALEEQLNEAAGLTTEQLNEKLYLDAVLPFDQITDGLLNELSLLEPYGNGNQTPVFAASGVHVISMRRMGKEGEHCRLTLVDRSGKQLSGLLFHKADEIEAFFEKEYGETIVPELTSGRCAVDVRMSFAFSPSMNEYKGVRSPQIMIKAYKRTL